MISAALMLIILGLVMKLMVVGTNRLDLMEKKAELQREMSLAFVWMVREMRETDADSIQTQPDGVIFATPRNTDGDVLFDTAGRLLWHQYYCYYVDTVKGKSVLLRKSRSISPPAFSPPPAPPVDSLRLSTTAPTKIKARNIKALSVDSTVSPMELTLMGEVTARGDRTYGMELKTRVYFRN